MNIARLKLMVKMLSEVEAGTWKLPKKSVIAGIDSMPSYREEEHKNQFDLSFWSFGTKALECGFTACAVGHACFDKRFNKQGLEFDWSDTPTFDGSSSWVAVEKFFEIRKTTAIILFSGGEYPEHLKGNALVVQVRRRIEKLLELGDETKLRNMKYNFGYDDVRSWEEYLISKAGRIYKVKT